MATLKGNASNTIYGGGDTCLHLNPFDSYRLFTLYENWKSDDRKPLDLSIGQNLYLVFKSKKREIRIPEVDTTYTDYTVDKVNGQVLFKINQKNAIDILSMDNNIFYITRVYEMYDGLDANKITSDEEVVFTGRWKDDSDTTLDTTTSQLKTLSDTLAERNSTIKDLQATIANLMAQNVDYAERIEELTQTNNTLANEVSELELKLNEYENGMEYSGTVIGEGTYTNIISTRQYTEDELKDALKNLETTNID